MIGIKNDNLKFERLKRAVSEWVIALDTKQYALKDKLNEIELRLKELEDLHKNV